ncbi:MAG: TraB/GumN family protein [Chitinophagaceae bacterium]|nr:TraB/GumN family protein [Chitinophagaceae bacterium]
MQYFKNYVILVLISLCTITTTAQKKQAPTKYPSLFWEITGNGLKKPSYLFGTMHVSSKLVFHLSDSFYYALKNVDAVALELNPDIWQGQMVRLAKMQENYARFTKASGEDFLTENSFRINKYEDELKLAMSTEPTVVNSLLYRSYKAKEDFEEDTFLDLYIFQTGKKLGKRATGVEDYYETEKIVMEAYTDMAKEKEKNN